MTLARKSYRFAEFTVNPARRTLFQNDTEIKLNDREFDVLLFLIERTPDFCSFDEIISVVWNGTNVQNNSVEKIITNVRKALGDGRKESRFIKTRRGKGYSFICEVQEIEHTAAKHFQSGKATVGKPRRGLRSALLALCFACIILVAGFFLWQGSNALAGRNTKTIFADDFSGKDIDRNRWIVQGKTVTVENGIVKLRAEETDNWGRLASVFFSFDPSKPLVVTSRMKVTYSRNLKNKSYFIGTFGLAPKMSFTNSSDIGSRLLFGMRYANHDHESKFPNGEFEYVSSEGFFIVRGGGHPTKKADYRDGKVSERIAPVWDKWFEQKLVYEPTGKMTYFIDGQAKGEFDVGAFSTDLRENALRLEIIPSGWWLYHAIEIDYIYVTQ